MERKVLTKGAVGVVAWFGNDSKPSTDLGKNASAAVPGSRLLRRDPDLSRLATRYIWSCHSVPKRLPSRRFLPLTFLCRNVRLAQHSPAVAGGRLLRLFSMHEYDHLRFTAHGAVESKSAARARVEEPL